jgi:RecQ family ATP-dependent DNA helicase
MATGSGKSVCYQLPAVALRKQGQRGITIVITPLISLAEDQVSSLTQMGIPAVFLEASSSTKVYQRILQGEYALVYLTPEKACTWTHQLQQLHQRQGIVCVAVDESHCVAEWGHDFRPSFLNLHTLRQHLPQVPVMALTATATPKVQEEIISRLKLRDPLRSITSFNRVNLHYRCLLIACVRLLIACVCLLIAYTHVYSCINDRGNLHNCPASQHRAQECGGSRVRSTRVDPPKLRPMYNLLCNSQGDGAPGADRPTDMRRECSGVPCWPYPLCAQ